MPRLLHLADLHLGWIPRDLPPAVAEARRAARDARLEEAVELALERRLHAVLIVGDLFDDFDPASDLVRSVREALERLTSAGIAVVTVPGNHDELTYANSVYRREASRWPGVLVREPMPAHLASLSLAGEPFQVHGLAYVGGVTDVAEAMNRLPPRDRDGRHLFLAHGTLTNTTAEGADERSMPLPPGVLADAGYDYLALGHLHTPSERRLGGSLAVYPGCVGGKGFDDPGSDAWSIVTFTQAGPRIERVAMAGQSLVDGQLDVSDLEHEGDVAEAISARLAGHAGDLVRIRLTGALPTELDTDELTASCRGEALFLRVEDHTTAVTPSLLDAWGASPTVRGEFVRRLREKLDASQDPGERRRLVRALRMGLDALGGRR